MTPLHFFSRSKLPLKIALVPLTCGIVAWLMLANPHEAEAGWAEDALKTEADYIVNCSFTAQTQNNAQVQTGDAAYGALNNVRVAVGADWVRPGEGAMGIIGLMAAATQLHQAGEPIDKYNAVIDAFFQTWLLKNRAAISQKVGDPNFGGFAPQIAYSDDGSQLKTAPTEYNSGTTGALLCAMWKYAEYNRNTGRAAQATAWMNGSAYGVALDGAKFIARCHNAQYNLVAPSPVGGDMWINDSSLAVAALRCVAKWSAETGKSAALDNAGTTPTQLADAIATGLEKMKDEGRLEGFLQVPQRDRRFALLRRQFGPVVLCTLRDQRARSFGRVRQIDQRFLDERRRRSPHDLPDRRSPSVDIFRHALAFV